MATVYDVAKYIIDEYGAMSAMKLQKLVFYSQAMSLVWDDVPLFDDDFEAWAKGPVCPALFDAHKGRFMLQDSRFLDSYCPNTNNLSTEQKETIAVVVDSLKDYPPYKLSEMTHQEEPWQIARGDLPPGAKCHNIITKESMEEYYGKNW